MRGQRDRHGRRRRAVRHVLLRLPLPAAGGRIQPAANGPGHPAGRGNDAGGIARVAPASDADRSAARLVLGPVLSAGGLLWMSFLSFGDGYWAHMLVPLAMFGLGVGTTFVPMTLTATAGVPGHPGGPRLRPGQHSPADRRRRRPGRARHDRRQRRPRQPRLRSSSAGSAHHRVRPGLPGRRAAPARRRRPRPAHSLPRTSPCPLRHHQDARSQDSVPEQAPAPFGLQASLR